MGTERTATAVRTILKGGGVERRKKTVLMYLLSQIREGIDGKKEQPKERKEVTVWRERVWEEPIAALRRDEDDSAEAEGRS